MGGLVGWTIAGFFFMLGAILLIGSMTLIMVGVTEAIRVWKKKRGLK